RAGKCHAGTATVRPPRVALNDRDVRALLELFTDDAVVIRLHTSGSWPQVYVGQAQVPGWRRLSQLNRFGNDRLRTEAVKGPTSCRPLPWSAGAKHSSRCRTRTRRDRTGPRTAGAAGELAGHAG